MPEERQIGHDDNKKKHNNNKILWIQMANK